jgi:NADH-quinone oxidoreductase subunit G
MERVIHRDKPLTITIDGKKCSGVYGQTILQIARENDIYIPTMCYLTKITPIASCRMCIVNVEGVDGSVLSCQEKAVDGAVIATVNDELIKQRQNIMKLYNVNHPLQCGVCDKSGECDLQNKTLEFKVDSQEFATVEQNRKLKNWGILAYDPYLCIMCEKCVHTCNEIVGTEALYIKPGGYKSVIDIHYRDCVQCGECISVCPVGALGSNGFKYSANAWEAKKVPATCAHCSSGCSLEYNVKHSSNNNPYGSTIARVKNEYEFASLCGAGRFGFDFENSVDENISLDSMVEAIKNADGIKFDSYITNEEAYILQQIKKTTGKKLINNDALNYQNFMKAYSIVSGNRFDTLTLDDVANSDMIICIGSRITNDNPMVKYKINQALKKNRAEIVYMHPIEDDKFKKVYTQFIKYEAGSEEGVVALLASYLTNEQSDDVKTYLDNLDIGYLSGETSVGEEECELIVKKLPRRENKTIIVGQDLLSHTKASNIAKLVAVIEKYSDFKVLIVPSQTNTLGVSLICDLDKDCKNVINLSDGSLFNLPALNQQEGTFTTIDKKVVPINVALSFGGHCLNDIANKFNVTTGGRDNYTIAYTENLKSANKSYKPMKFDDLDCEFDKAGNDLRGYELKNKSGKSKEKLDEISDISTYNGTVVYECNPINQFNESTYKSGLLNDKVTLEGSSAFATAGKVSDGDTVELDYNGSKTTILFKVNSHLKGTIALLPTFSGITLGDASSYRYKQVKITKVEQ